MTIIAVGVFVWTQLIAPVNRQWAAIESLDESVINRIEIVKEPSNLPSWLLWLLKENRRENITGLTISGSFNEVMIDPRDLPFLEKLKLTNPSIPSGILNFSIDLFGLQPAPQKALPFDELDSWIAGFAKLPKLESFELQTCNAEYWRVLKHFDSELNLKVTTNAMEIASGELPFVESLFQNEQVVIRKLPDGFAYHTSQTPLHLDIEKATDEDLAQLESMLASGILTDPSNITLRLSFDLEKVSPECCKFLASYRTILFPADYQFDPMVHDSRTLPQGLDRYWIERSDTPTFIDSGTMKIFCSLCGDAHKLSISQSEFRLTGTSDNILLLGQSSPSAVDGLQLPEFNQVRKVGWGIDRPFQMSDAKMISRLPHVKSLSINSKHELPLDFFKSIEQDLTSLYLYGSDVSREHLMPLLSRKSLKTFEMRSSKSRFKWSYMNRQAQTLEEALQEFVIRE